MEDATMTTGMQKFVRIRVQVDVTQVLKPMCYITRKNGNQLWIMKEFLIPVTCVVKSLTQRLHVKKICRRFPNPLQIRQNLAPGCEQHAVKNQRNEPH